MKWTQKLITFFVSFYLTISDLSYQQIHDESITIYYLIGTVDRNTEFKLFKITAN